MDENSLSSLFCEGTPGADATPEQRNEPEPQESQEPPKNGNLPHYVQVCPSRREYFFFNSASNQLETDYLAYVGSRGTSTSYKCLAQTNFYFETRVYC